VIYCKAFTRVGKVCPKCGWHGPLTADERVEALLDEGSTVTWQPGNAHCDPLDLVDIRSYPKARAAAPLPSAAGYHDGELRSANAP
jgi:acetyl-CoA carboxylase carboxyl transferase subunit beta